MQADFGGKVHAHPLRDRRQWRRKQELQRQHQTQQRMQHHRDRQADDFLVAEARLLPNMRHPCQAYGALSELSVTCVIEVKPARPSSPITAITRP